LIDFLSLTRTPDTSANSTLSPYCPFEVNRMFAALGSSGLVWCVESPRYAFQVKGDQQAQVAEQLAAWLNGLLTSHVSIFERPPSKENLETLKAMVAREFDNGGAEIIPMMITS
jgi:hypothetical protein